MGIIETRDRCHQCNSTNTRYLFNRNNSSVYRCCYDCWKTSSVKKKDYIGKASGCFKEFDSARAGYWRQKLVEWEEKRRQRIVESKEFFSSEAWRRLRFHAFHIYGNRCLCCGRMPPDVVLHVDHILPRSTHPDLALDINNLQILCADCNFGKSNTYKTDFRPRQRPGA